MSKDNLHTPEKDSIIIDGEAAQATKHNWTSEKDYNPMFGFCKNQSNLEPAKSNLSVVETLHEGSTPKVSSLHDRLMLVVYDYIENNPEPTTNAEIVGTLEFVKNEIMGIAYEDDE